MEKVVRNLDELPFLLKVEELQHALRVNRERAYEIASMIGLRFGRSIRIPRQRLAEFIEQQN